MCPLWAAVGGTAHHFTPLPCTWKTAHHSVSLSQSVKLRGFSVFFIASTLLVPPNWPKQKIRVITWWVPTNDFTPHDPLASFVLHQTQEYCFPFFFFQKNIFCWTYLSNFFCHIPCSTQMLLNKWNHQNVKVKKIFTTAPKPARE